jgi:hypothetical protein
MAQAAVDEVAAKRGLDRAAQALLRELSLQR